MAALERFDDQHCAAATGARFPQCEWCGIILGWWFLLWCACPNQGSDLCNVDFTLRGRQQAIVPDPVEPVGQNMHHETADELVCCQAQHIKKYIFGLQKSALAWGVHAERLLAPRYLRQRHHLPQIGFTAELLFRSTVKFQI